MWMNRRRLFAFGVLVWWGAVALAAENQGAPRPAGEAPKPVRRYLQTVIAPDGRRLAWVEEIEAAPPGTAPQSAIFVADVAGGMPPQRVTAGAGHNVHAEHSLAWSPDSHRLAFLSDR